MDILDAEKLNYYCGPGNATIDRQDVVSTSSAIAYFVLAFLNLFVIAMGCYSFFLRIRAKDLDYIVVIFYLFALSCLTVAEVLFFSGLWTGDNCG